MEKSIQCNLVLIKTSLYTQLIYCFIFKCVLQSETFMCDTNKQKQEIPWVRKAFFYFFLF